MRNSRFVAIAVACLLGLASCQFSSAQVQFELPRVGGGIVLDGGAFFEGADFAVSGHGGMSISKSVNNGVTTINARSGDEKCVITEDPDNGIVVKLTQKYGPDQADEIAEEFPGLYMHLKSIPKNVDGAEVDVHVDVTRTFEAANEEELEDKHPAAFAAYEKYAKSNTANFGLIRGADLRLPMVVGLDDFDGEMEEMAEKMRAALGDRIELRLPEVGGAQIEIIDVESDDQAEQKSDNADEKDSKQQSDEKDRKKDT